MLGRLGGRELHEGTPIGVHPDGRYLAVGVELVPYLRFDDAPAFPPPPPSPTLVRETHVQRRDGALVPLPPPRYQLGAALLRLLPLPLHHPARDRIVIAEESILGVLLRERVVPIARRLVPERTQRPPVALPLGEEAAQLREVALVPRFHPRHALELHRCRVVRGDASRDRHALLDVPLGLRRHPRSVGVALGHRHDGVAAPLLGEDLVPHLHRQAVLQIVYAHLTYVLRSGARPAYLDLLQPTARPRLPREDREGYFAYLAFLAVGFLGHADVGVVPEARLADEGEFRLLPLLLAGVLLDGGTHGGVVGLVVVVLDKRPGEGRRGHCGNEVRDVWPLSGDEE